MKKIILISLLLFSSNLLAHGGGLNAYGCHNETKTGGYHCHRGSAGYQIGNEQGIISEYPPIESDVIEGLVLKNIRCTIVGLATDFVNRSNENMELEYLFKTHDSDKDPLKQYKGEITIGPESRERVLISGISAINTNNCEDVRYISFEISAIE